MKRAVKRSLPLRCVVVSVHSVRAPGFSTSLTVLAHSERKKNELTLGLVFMRPHIFSFNHILVIIKV